LVKKPKLKSSPFENDFSWQFLVGLFDQAHLLGRAERRLDQVGLGIFTEDKNYFI
jgi:hypothetical protein